MSKYEHLGCKITWNVGNESDAKVKAALIEMIRAERPIAVHLVEVWDRRKMLLGVCEATGYRPVFPGGTAGHCAMLLSPLTSTSSWGTGLLSERTWVGRKVAGAHDHGMARKNEMVYARYTHKGIKYVDTVVHLVPSHQVHKACNVAKRQVYVLTLWWRLRRRVAHLSGDFNETLTHPCDSLAPLERIAHPFTGKTHGDRAIDYWWTLKRQMKRLRYRITVLNGYPSDHRPLRLDIWRVS